jgi:hypothetical protein
MGGLSKQNPAVYGGSIKTTKQDLEIALNALELRLVKEIRDCKNQTLLAIGFAGLVQIGLHFWH